MRLFDGVYFSSRFCSFFPNTLAPPLRFCYNQSCRPQGADECFSLPSNFTQSGSSPPRRTPLIFFFRGACFFMNISYDSYRVFYYAAKYRSFSQAAAALYSNQPNVTRMIRKLESELGCAPCAGMRTRSLSSLTSRTVTHFLKSSCRTFCGGMKLEAASSPCNREEVFKRTLV